MRNDSAPTSTVISRAQHHLQQCQRPRPQQLRTRHRFLSYSFYFAFRLISFPEPVMYHAGWTSSWLPYLIPDTPLSTPPLFIADSYYHSRFLISASFPLSISPSLSLLLLICTYSSSFPTLLTTKTSNSISRLPTTKSINKHTSKRNAVPRPNPRPPPPCQPYDLLLARSPRSGVGGLPEQYFSSGD